MGVSATNTPNTWKNRLIFLLYVYYSFAMSTVFQAFSISYLLEPGYGKKYETLMICYIPTCFMDIMMLGN